MGFFSGIANFWSKILGGVKKAAQCVAPALHKVLSPISGPVGMIYPAIGGALGAGANLKRGNSSGGMMSNEEYQLFINNNNALVYAANNQIVDGIASDYALKIEISVPDQVTPANDAIPLSDGTATAGVSTEYSRGDHVHPLNITTTIPISDSASGSVGSTNYYARNDHSHPLNITTTILPQDSVSGSVETNASNIPIVNGVGANGTSAFYARQDHIHPQQLTYDGNVAVTKFIKLEDQRSGWVRLCVFPAGASVCSPFIEFKVYSSYNSVPIIGLQPFYTVNGINTAYGVFTAPTRFTSYYLIDNGANQLFHTHTGSGTAAIYSAYIRLETVGTGVSNGGYSSVNYSQGKAKQWGVNSTDPIGGFYSD
ncbi:MAG: hypothetical protein EZS28_003421 [Streblomastix strix]|uniref:Uncharacterized protein n=1 Tax=Streblomastix strix TaxID=222440 RepID=A0A5J4X223_9EUKA|nr:MAG: hypothetical protein EZS28_003421 [Streblomastix strix]